MPGPPGRPECRLWTPACGSCTGRVGCTTAPGSSSPRYLTKDLGIDWRLGYAEFDRWLLDGDVPNNAGNWQWTAGTGNDTRPYRRFNPQRQAERYDPAGAYIARYPS